jgi:anthranilate synthase component 1
MGVLSLSTEAMVGARDVRRPVTASDCPYQVLSKTYPVDQETPVTAFLKVRGLGAHTLLESVEGEAKVSRFSFIAVGSLATLTEDPDGLAVLDGEAGRMVGTSPTALLRAGWAAYRAPAPIGVELPYTGGAVGYFGFDWVRKQERVPSRHPPLAAGWSWTWPWGVLAFDHRRQTLTIIVQARVEEGAARLGERLDAVLEALGQGHMPTAADAHRTGPIESNLAYPAYEAMVEAGRRHIVAGDVFQVVLSQQFSAAVTGDPFGFYRRLRRLNPSPYLFYLERQPLTLAGASPEMLVRVSGHRALVRPIAGTRPRGRDAAEDDALWENLRRDEKECAEHVMLVDLGRNDLGRVAEVGTVRVDRLMVREQYSHVTHMVSEVSARLAAGRDALDALAATFPAGTLTGAPKVRALEIIDQLEPCGRGAYGGVVGYLSHAGDLDTAITIRTLEISSGRAIVQAGGGIVADSTPAREFEESVNKARALLQVLDGEEDWR